MRKFSIFFLILGMMGTLLAEGNGGYAGAFLRMGLGARGIAMGNAQTAAPPDGFGFFYNPASLPELRSMSANFTYSFLSLDRKMNYVGISTPLKPNAGFSLGWIFSGVGDIQGYNSIGEQTGKINHGYHAIYFSFGAQIIPNRLSIGVNAKYLKESISDEEGSYDYGGSGFGGDLGVLFRVREGLYLGYLMKDVNAKLKSNTNDIFEQGMTLDNQFPLTNVAGIYFQTPWKFLRLAYDFEWSTAGTEKHHAGVEFAIPQAAARFGYDHNHWTLGGGLNIHTAFGMTAILNYAFVSSVVDEGASHIFTWELAF